MALCAIKTEINLDWTVIYILQFFAEQVAFLRGHTGLVKGVTWDPVGKYLASQVYKT